MGRAVVELAEQNDVEIVGGFNTKNSGVDYHLDIDVIIDFSTPACLDEILKLSRTKGIPVVIASTGHTPAQLDEIHNHSNDHAVLKSANMSIGANTLLEVIACITPALKDFDIEIVETHHSKKHDVPSGTAKAMFNTVASVRPDSNMIQGRQSTDPHRQKPHIGLHSIRGGSHIGEHKIIYLGQSETLTITHTAQSREIFAQGAISASIWIKDKESGLYSMQDVLKQ